MFKIKGSGLSFSHPLTLDSTIPQDGLPEDRLLELTGRLRDGSISKIERDELAMSYIHVALAIAGRWACPSKLDDFIGCALFGVVKALNEAQAKMVDNNLDAWVMSCIHSACRRFRNYDHQVCVPQSTNATRIAAGKEPYGYRGVVSFSSFPMSDTVTPDDYLADHSREIEVREYDMTELDELMSLAAVDGIDREIIDMRLEDYTDEEIAEKLDYSTAFINNRRHGIGRRYQRIVGK